MIATHSYYSWELESLRTQFNIVKHDVINFNFGKW